MSRDEASVLDMLYAAKAAVGYSKGIQEDDFRKDRMRQLAVERLLEVIGEAAKRISDSFKEAHPEVPWLRAAGLRDVISHEYNRVDMTIIWTIVTTNLPDLIAALDPLTTEEA